MLFGEIGPKAGRYLVRIDGGVEKEYGAPINPPPSGELRYVEMIAQNLDPHVDHQIEITPKLQPGQELRLESVCVAGAPAQVAER